LLQCVIRQLAMSSAISPPSWRSTIVRAVNDNPKSTLVTSWGNECSSSSSSECNGYYKKEGQGWVQPLNRWHTFDYDGCFILKRILLWGCFFLYTAFERLETGCKIMRFSLQNRLPTWTTIDSNNSIMYNAVFFLTWLYSAV
jgi:hypothetical protein